MTRQPNLDGSYDDNFTFDCINASKYEPHFNVLNILPHNLSILSSFLRDKDTGEICRVFRRLLEVIRRYTDISLFDYTPECWGKDRGLETFPIDRQRLCLLSILAQSLGALQIPDPECRQLELEIWRQYLKNGSKYSNNAKRRLEYGEGEMTKRLLLPPQEYEAAYARIAELSGNAAKPQAAAQPSNDGVTPALLLSKPKTMNF